MLLLRSPARLSVRPVPPASKRSAASAVHRLSAVRLACPSPRARAHHPAVGKAGRVLALGHRQPGRSAARYLDLREAATSQLLACRPFGPAREHIRWSAVVAPPARRAPDRWPLLTWERRRKNVWERRQGAWPHFPGCAVCGRPGVFEYAPHAQPPRRPPAGRAERKEHARGFQRPDKRCQRTGGAARRPGGPHPPALPCTPLPAPAGTGNTPAWRGRLHPRARPLPPAPAPGSRGRRRHRVLLVEKGHAPAPALVHAATPPARAGAASLAPPTPPHTHKLPPRPLRQRRRRARAVRLRVPPSPAAGEPSSRAPDCPLPTLRAQSCSRPNNCRSCSAA